MSFTSTYSETNRCVKQREGVILRHLAGEHLLVPASTREVNLDHLFLLNGTGIFIWDRLDGCRQMADLAAAVSEEFEVPVEQAQADVELFVASLLEHHLAEEVGGHVG